MIQPRFIEAVVAALVDCHRRFLPSYLRRIETETGMERGELTDPVEILDHRAPLRDESPLVWIFDNRLRTVNQNQRQYDVQCTIVVSHFGDADLGDNEVFVRRYMSAIISLLLDNQTLGGAVTQMLITDGDSGILQGSRSQARFLYGLGVACRINDPKGTS